MINTSKIEKVFPFTNENLTSYGKIYDFNNAKVLSVLGSGDQYFSSILHGAKEVELYDINVNAWDHFILKYYGILILSYEEFFRLFLIDRLQNPEILNRVLPHLPYQTRKNLELFIQTKGSLYEYIFVSRVHIKSHNYKSGRIIPYLNKNEYYRLQAMLRERKIPAFYLYNITELPDVLNQNTYDIILTSNINQWLNIPVEDYKSLISRFKCSTIQAAYHWILAPNEKREYLKNGFEIEGVYSAVHSSGKDKVITLRQ